MANLRFLFEAICPIIHGMTPRGSRKWLALLMTALFALWLTGCATIPGARKDLLTFLQVGTAREEVMLRLGQPSGVYERERILTYRIGEDHQQGKYIVSLKTMMPYWEQVRYSLVLVFDANGRLEKQNLVPVN